MTNLMHHSGTRTNPPLVLLVDDSDDNRELYSVYLGRRGFGVAEAADAQSAIEQAVQAQPDVVVMDLVLPDMDGTKAIHLLKHDDRTKHLPILVVSGYRRAEFEDESERDWDSFLMKPCLPDVLVAEIERLLAREGPSGADARC